MRRLVRATILAAVLTFWPERMWGAEQQTAADTVVGSMLINMAWCLPSGANPALPVDTTGDEEWLRVEIEGLEFALMWTDPNASRNFRNIPHHSDPRLRIAFPHQFERFSGRVLTDDELAMVQVFTLMAVGCFSMS